ncbi:MAG: hypothetical protein ACNYWM_11795 [Methanosarcinales archaeon]
MPACELESIVKASDQIPFKDLEDLIKYVSHEIKAEPTSDQGDYIALVIQLKQDFENRKVREYGFYTYI